MNYFTADLHFGHLNIITYCKRPFVLADGQPSLAMMHKELTDGWNSRVKDDDDVYVLGDFAFGPVSVSAKYLANLKGRKHLVRGNHDRHSTKAYLSAGFTTVVKHMWLGAYFLIHRPQDFRAHVPADRRPLTILSGHHHEQYRVKHMVTDQVSYINVGVDVRGFRPATLPELLGTSGWCPPSNQPVG